MCEMAEKRRKARWSIGWTGIRVKDKGRGAEVHAEEGVMNDFKYNGEEEEDFILNSDAYLSKNANDYPFDWQDNLTDLWPRASASVLEKDLNKRCITQRWPNERLPKNMKLAHHQSDNYASVTDVDNLRIYTSTWNLGGKFPSDNLKLDEVLQMSSPSDIYVLGFQEIVPLNAANVLGTKDTAPATKWVSLINETLNSRQPQYTSGFDNFSSSQSSDSESLHSDVESPSMASYKMNWKSRVPKQNMRKDSSYKLEEDLNNRSNRFSAFSVFESSRRSTSEDVLEPSDQSRYSLIVCKQMVGVFLAVWVRTELKEYVKHIRFCCVGRGLMGYLRNKGCVSISMSVHKTSFCFMCCHLASGQKDGDELRRNSDVLEILRSTCFPSTHKSKKKKKKKKLPKTVLDHDQVIWLGDMNYRISLSYEETKKLVQNNDWDTLLKKDQLRTEQKAGKIFNGWKEGNIYFAPTYKYSFNSDQYVGESEKGREKRRTPAWCDRILWLGDGLKQLSYVRGELRFSDHRPVYAIFLAEVDKTDIRRLLRSNTR